MSTPIQETLPITPSAFAAALPPLPLSSLHAKAAELFNSIHHMQRSNILLEPHAEAGDADCADAIKENKVTITSMRERIQLCKEEVLQRGMEWPWPEGLELADGNEKAETNGVASETQPNGGESTVEGQGTERPPETAASGSLTDAELARRMAERLGPHEGENGDEDGVHL
ncbi:hypothetical protein K402DRAFT_328676 [Aulographum hederae CBS 113979]|uniref:Uncharacterized protein n=1 Tax=Aulographum hederae CBS 113979 TaxID=1176131 RepID=A0A6G1H5X5_9PEZI|nr:hypothetical protein K402DRAFT_328676 [Aulographum hederae CBS 113979]